MTKPSVESVPAVYHRYIERVAANSLTEALTEDFEALKSIFKKLNANQLNFAYDEDKWTLKQVLLHLIDTERILSYRALRFGRGDRLEINGFDQDLYAQSPGLKARSKKSLLDEFDLIRRSTRILFAGMNADELRREGIANGYMMSAENIGFVIAGHALHHLEVIHSHYLNSVKYPQS